MTSVAQTTIRSCTITRSGMEPRTIELMQYQDDVGTYEVTVSALGDPDSWDTVGDRMKELEARCLYGTTVLAHAGAF